MKIRKPLLKALIVFLALLLGAPQGVIAQSEGGVVHRSCFGRETTSFRGQTVICFERG
jgi:hypothetical protein